MKRILSAITVSLLFICGHTAFAAEKSGYISYTDTGRGAPLVLIHAFPASQQLWTPQQKKLKHYFRVITLDLWGFGRSAATDGQAVTMSNYADEVNQLLTRLHIKKAIIGGESMGGYVALAFLKKYPEKTAGLVLSDTQSIEDGAEAKTKREAAAVDVLQHGTAQLIDGFMPKALSAGAPPKTKAYLLKIVKSQQPTAVASALRGMALRENTNDVLAGTSLPILILTGDQDSLISPQQSNAMHALAKNSKLVTISNAGHLSSLEQPQQWNDAVINMFSFHRIGFQHTK